MDQSRGQQTRRLAARRTERLRKGLVGSVTQGCILQRSGVRMVVCGLENLSAALTGPWFPAPAAQGSHTCRASPVPVQPPYREGAEIPG